MTRNLLAHLALVKAPGPLRLMLGICALPILPVTLVLDLMSAWSRMARLTLLASMEHVECPRGHQVALIASGWTCAGCGAVREGHAFLPCSCGLAAAMIACPCGLTVANPAFEDFA